jgi:hypothetical protein
MNRLPVVGIAFAVLLGACGVQQEAQVWDGAAARAVARHVEAATPGTRVVALSTAGIGGAELPWDVRQALTTGGTEVVSEDPAAAGTALLIFERSGQRDGDWLLDTTLQGRAQTDFQDELPVPHRAQWRVRCDAEPCEVVEVVPRP